MFEERELLHKSGEATHDDRDLQLLRVMVIIKMKTTTSIEIENMEICAT